MGHLIPPLNGNEKVQNMCHVYNYYGVRNKTITFARYYMKDVHFWL